MRSFAIVFTLLIAPFALAQDDANKKATQILLDKAEEEYRTYFKRPESTIELWAAIKFEIDVGKFDLAALHIKRLLTNEKQKPEQVDDDLFKIEGVEGMSSFLRLIRVQRWSDHAPFQKEAETNVKTFFERLTGAVDKRLSDADRINKFIRQLDAETEEERHYAFVQINRSRERAVPYLIEKLQENVGKPLHHRIVEAMVNLDPETVPAYLEVLKARDERDARDQELRLTLLRILRSRADARVVPYLWHLSASRQYPGLIRETALNTLADFLKTDKDLLPPAKLALAEMSDKYFRHQTKLPQKSRLWRWDGVKVSTEPIDLTPSQVEELFGTRHALEALELDPSFVPAQLAYLNLTMERTVLQDFEQAILKPLPNATQRLFATLDPDLVLRVQERAYDDANIPIILGTIRTLGDRGELRAAKPSAFGLPQGIVRGLYYPDRRVQYQAVNALLKMPGDQTPVAAARTVEALQRLVLVDQPALALVIGASIDKKDETLKAVDDAGFKAIPFQTVQQALNEARTKGNVEAIFLHHGMTRELPFALGQIRKDIDFGLTPVIMIAPADSVAGYEKLLARFKNVRVLSETMVPAPDEIKKIVDDLTVTVGLAKLTPDERKAIAARSLDVLHQMARNQVPGYDVRPTVDNVTIALQNPDNAPLALEILGRLPGSVPQARLADVVLDPAKDKLRVAAAHELNRHVQHNGLLLAKNQYEKLKGVYFNKDTEIPLKTELSYFVGSFRTTPTRDGISIFQFRPDPAVAPQPPAEKKE